MSQIKNFGNIIIENQITKNSMDYNEENFAKLLEKHLNSTSVTPDGIVYSIKQFVASTNGLKIELYPKDHFPPHFHVVSKERDLNARFNLETFDYISTKSGKITDKQKRQIKNFLEENSLIAKKLKDTYNKLQG